MECVVVVGIVEVVVAVVVGGIAVLVGLPATAVA